MRRKLIMTAVSAIAAIAATEPGVIQHALLIAVVRWYG
jgi:hypothetical protein